jgi:hypothetical protein
MPRPQDRLLVGRQFVDALLAILVFPSGPVLIHFQSVRCDHHAAVASGQQYGD